jgi:hypothetical protein
VRRLLLSVLALAALAAPASCAGGPAAKDAGTVHFVGAVDSSFDRYVERPSTAAKRWLVSHMWRMTVYSPYFDQRTRWYPNGWVYDDAYAIYSSSSLAARHPQWILKDASGNPLYIPFDCSRGTCPQYAADISNSSYRAYWIANLRAELRHGYRGVFIDDVNMNRNVGNGSEDLVAPITPTTAKPLSEDAWRGYMATFMREVRAAFPKTEIVHNVIWFADEHAGTHNTSIRSEIHSANYIYLERGANDSGLTGGSGPWSLSSFLSYIDEVHALGEGIVLDGSASDPQGLAYNLATYFLISTGKDAVSGADQTPDDWWPGWNINLGEATGSRYHWQGLLRRDFSGGLVLVNPPQTSTRVISLPRAMENVDGAAITSVTLPPASGAILRSTGSPSVTDHR